jgi:hypothetical protein
MGRRLRLVGLTLSVLAVAIPAAAQGAGRRVEVGASLVNFMAVFPDQGGKSVLFGVPSGSFGLLGPSVYAAIFAGPQFAIEPQFGLLVISSGGNTNHVVDLAGQVDYFVYGTTISSPYMFGAVGLVAVSNSDTTPKQVSVGGGYRMRFGDRLVLRFDGRYTHFTGGDGNGVGFNLSIGGIFGR